MLEAMNTVAEGKSEKESESPDDSETHRDRLEPEDERFQAVISQFTPEQQRRYQAHVRSRLPLAKIDKVYLCIY